MFSKVLVPLDLQDQKGTEQTLTAVKNVANAAGEILLLTVMPDMRMPLVASYFPKGNQEKALGALRHVLEKLAGEHLEGYQVSCLVVLGDAQEQIVTAAKKEQVDTILMKAYQHGSLDRLMLGSVTAKVVERSPCSVLVLK